MKEFIWLIPLLFSLHVVFAGCDERGRQRGPGKAPSPSIPSTSTLSDSDLEKAVRAKLENDAQLANLSVNADAERNEVTLAGSVRTHAAREKAIELAKGAKSGVLVNDKIDVKPGS